MKALLITIIFVFIISLPAFSDTTSGLNNSNLGLSINYGIVNNFKMWDSSSSETGNMIQIGYIYKPNDKYSLELDLAFIADSNTFNNSSTPTYVETASYLNIKHSFYMYRTQSFSPYLHFGTGLYGVNSWLKTGKTFYSKATNIFADVSAGLGCDINIKDNFINLDISMPALLHALYGNVKIPYIISIGCKHLF